MGKKAKKTQNKKNNTKKENQKEINKKENIIQTKKNEITEEKITTVKPQKDKKEKIKNLITFIIYAILLLLVASHHELWRDEAQSWLIAKNLGYIKIISQLKYEAHPFVWYYILRTFSIFNLKYEHITIIPVILNLITTYILLNKSKFNRITNIIIVFSSSFFFYCGVLTRSYSVAYLLVTLLSIIYKDRHEKPIQYGLLLFLIMNTHILLLGFIGGLVLVDIYEYIKTKENKKQIITSIISFLLGTGMIILQFCQTINSTGKGIHFEYLKNVFSQMKQLFMPAINSDFLYIITIIAIITYIIHLINQKEFKNLIILSCSLLFQILFATMVYNSINAASLVYVTLLFSLMQSEKITKYVNTITIIIFGLTLYGTWTLADNDYKYLFSDSKNVAKYIEKNIESGSKIYCELLDYCAAVNAHLPDGAYHFIDYNTDKEYTYTEYGDYYKILYNQAIYKKEGYLTEKTMDYFISIVSNKEVLEYHNKHEDYELIYETEEPVMFSKERYLVYKHK